MSVITKQMVELVQELPPDLLGQVYAYAEFLLTQHDQQLQGQQPNPTLQQGWAGALRNYRQQYISLELERKALDWRGD